MLKVCRKLLHLVKAFKRYKQKYTPASLFLDHPVYVGL